MWHFEKNIQQYNHTDKMREKIVAVVHYESSHFSCSKDEIWLLWKQNWRVVWMLCLSEENLFCLVISFTKQNRKMISFIHYMNWCSFFVSLVVLLSGNKPVTILSSNEAHMHAYVHTHYHTCIDGMSGCEVTDEHSCWLCSAVLLVNWLFCWTSREDTVLLLYMTNWS